MEEKRKLCFVMMPSGNHGEYKGGKEESDFIYQGIIIPALNKSLGDTIEIVREVDNRNPGAITNKLIQHIALADICIVDITGQNPNVFLELGIRYALRKSTTILLKQTETFIPFDITNYRCVEYSSFFMGPQKAIEDIVDIIKLVVSQRPRPCDSLVFDVFPQMTVEIPGVMKEKEEEITPSKAMMSWTEYWARLQSVVGKLKDRFQDGRFKPDVILGISNGGLMYADLLGRELFHGIPILSLWADRYKRDSYFENSINDSIMEGIRSWVPKPQEKIEVLLVDDIVASGTTLGQALRYLKSKLSEPRVYFLPLFSRNEKYFDLIKENIVWLSPGFSFTDNDVIAMHTVEKILLPYNKEIRST